MMFFQIEKVENIVEEVKGIVHRNGDTIKVFENIKLDPDYETYIKADNMGILKLFTMRDNDCIIRGYSVFLVQLHLHFKTSLQAVQDLVFVDKDFRRYSLMFMKWVDDMLKDNGVKVVYRQSSYEYPIEKVLNKMNYKPIEKVFGKELWV